MGRVGNVEFVVTARCHQTLICTEQGRAENLARRRSADNYLQDRWRGSRGNRADTITKLFEGLCICLPGKGSNHAYALVSGRA